jgi:hypothetical protein
MANKGIVVFFDAGNLIVGLIQHFESAVTHEFVETDYN